MQKPKMLPFFFAALLLTGCSVQYEYAEPQTGILQIVGLSEK